MLKSLIKVLCVLFCIALVFSCEKVTLEFPEIELPDSLSFSLDIIPIFEEKCISCHAGNISPNLSAVIAYDNLITGGYVSQDTTITPAESSLLYQKLKGSHDDRATQIDKAKILEWIKQGAKDN